MTNDLSFFKRKLFEMELAYTYELFQMMIDKRISIKEKLEISSVIFNKIKTLKEDVKDFEKEKP